MNRRLHGSPGARTARSHALLLVLLGMTAGVGCGGGDGTGSSSTGNAGTGGSTSASTGGMMSASTGGAGGSDSMSSGGGGATVSVYHHGDMVTIDGAFGTNDVTKTFLGGADGMIESKAIDQSMASGAGWSFNDLGGPTTVALDGKRGKVLYTPEDVDHYNATRRFDPGFAIGEQRYFYKAHYVRNVMLLDGQPYTKSYQWKHERVNWVNSVSDSSCEIKVLNWPTSQGPITVLNRSATDGSTFWGGAAADSNGDWALLEIMVFTGTEGQQDGKLVTRVHKNGKTVISQNKQPEKIYADPTLRLRYFVEQNYFGNFGQVEDGVDNGMPKPQVREVYSDDSRVIVGNTATSGWKRIELRDSVALEDATLREMQDWTSWDGAIHLRLNAGGLPKGLHDLFLVVIDGIDAGGWDVVTHTMPVRVEVK